MRKVWLVFLIIIANLAQAQNVNSNITLKMTNQPLELILDSISRKTNFFFSYNSAIVPDDRKFTCDAVRQSLPEFLDELFAGSGIGYTFSNDQIILKRAYDNKAKPPPGPSKFTLYGWARDIETGEYIPGVNVYLDGTSIGTVTNINGYYKFENVPYGVYMVVFSHVSYEKFSFDFTVKEAGAAVVNGELNLRTNELEGIEIRSTKWIRVPPEARPQAYDIFQREFLGDTYNARRCAILNQEAIEFYTDESKDTLFAETTAPLRIRNEALGYMIIYELEFFQNFSDGVVYSGNVRFEPLPLLEPRDRRKWKRNRKRAYRGSMRHFLKALVQDELRKQGFKVYATEDLTFISDDTSDPLKREDILIKSKSAEWTLSFDGYIYVEFVKEKESDLYMVNMSREIQQRALLTGDNIFFLARKPDEQRSLLKLKQKAVNVDANGHITLPLAVSTVGYWAWERFADLLPTDYDPKNDIIR